MPISDLCASKLFTIERDTSLQQAARLMKKHHIGGLIVVEADGKNKPVGILTDRDIVLGVVAENLPATTKVADVMSTNIIRINKNEGVATTVEKMALEGVRRMIVTDDAGNACGLVSSDDILQLVAREMYDLGRLVQRQIENEKTFREEQKQLMI